MRTKLLAGLLMLTSLWAAFISVLYWQLKSNPRVIAVTTQVQAGLIPQEQLSESEKVTFLRQFLDRYFNYDSNNFWQSQTSLAFLMTSKLGEERVREVSRLRDKIQQKNLSQRARLQTLQYQKDGTYNAQIILLTRESDKETTPETVYVQMRIRLQNAERTLENPWGLLVSHLQFQNSAKPFVFTKDFSLDMQNPLTIALPCAVQNLENADAAVKIKITTLNVSELQVTVASGFHKPATIIASCKDRHYKLNLNPPSDQWDLYAALPSELGEARNQTRPRKKDAYEQTIEKVLGITLEN